MISINPTINFAIFKLKLYQIINLFLIIKNNFNRLKCSVYIMLPSGS